MGNSLHFEVSGRLRVTGPVLNSYDRLFCNYLGGSIRSFKVISFILEKVCTLLKLYSFPLHAASHHLDLLGSQGFAPADGFRTCIIRCPSRAQGLQSAAAVPADHR